MTNSEGKGGTFFIPGMPGVKKGDTLDLTVVSVDPDNGDLEVRKTEVEKSPEEENRPLLAQAFGQPMEGQQQGYG